MLTSSRKRTAQTLQGAGRDGGHFTLTKNTLSGEAPDSPSLDESRGGHGSAAVFQTATSEWSFCMKSQLSQCSNHDA